VRTTLAVGLGEVRLPTPVMIASGCFSSPKDLGGLLDLRKVGGIVTRSVTLEPNAGAPTPRMAETAGGLLTAIGMQNPGVDLFLDELQGLGTLGVPVFASIAGGSVEEYMRVAARMVALRVVSALELNLSSPNAARGGRLFACDPDQAAEACAAVSGVARPPVFAKLSSEGADVVEMAKACVSAGARGVTLINTIPGYAIDPSSGRPRLASGIGGLSGPAIKPIALLAVHRVAEALPQIPVIGVGGVTTAADALEFMAAGAWAVQVGTAMFTNPAAPVEIALGIGRHLVAAGVRSPADLRTSSVEDAGEGP
jgi:dihydroorotate dehydrogenase (NAD+) catalytic subunit